MKNLFVFLISLFLSLPTYAQSYLGVFETGDTIPFMVIAAEASTASPTNPINLQYSIMSGQSEISSGTMATPDLGVGYGSYSTIGDATGT